MSDLDFYDLESIHDEFDLNDDLPTKYQNIKLSEEEIELGSLDYSKARKRRQNRESAVRARARKKILISQVAEESKFLQDCSEKLEVENLQLKVENELLKKELEFYKNMIL